MKKLVKTGLLLLLVFYITQFSTLTAIADTNNEFAVDGNGVSTEYRGAGGAVIIPNSVKNINIGFNGRKDITSIIIPDSVTAIFGNAFGDCTGLSSVTIPNTVDYMGYNVFGNCTSLTDVTFPNSMETIPYNTFGGCTSLRNINIPTSVTSIGDYAFYDCTSLTSIVIPSSVTSIGENAFTYIERGFISVGDEPSEKKKCILKTIYGEPNSYAQTYASVNNIPFKIYKPTPKISIVSLEHVPFVEGDNDEFYISAKDYTGQVQYQLFYIQESAMTEWKLINNKDMVKGWTEPIDAQTPIAVDISNLSLKAGEYRFAIRVRRVGVTGLKQNSYGDYDDAYPFNVDVVKNASIELSGDMNIEKTDFNKSEKLVINAAQNSSKDIQYKLHLFDVKNSKWLTDLTEYSTNINYSLENVPTGTYIIDLWAKNINSKSKYDGWKLKVITIIEGYQPIDYLTNMDDVTRKKADEIIASVIKPGMSDFDKELALYNYVVTHAEYDSVNNNKGTVPLDSHEAYGILIKGIGVCDGYAKAMALLLNKVGIECSIAVNENHAWNIVKIDGSWYHLDATNGDSIGIESYFNLTDDQFAFNHKWDRTKYPVCNEVKYGYKNYMYCRDNGIPLDNRTRVISGIVSLSNGDVAENDLSIEVKAWKNQVYRESPEERKVYDNYQSETSIVIPKGSSFAPYTLVVPAFEEGFTVHYEIPGTNVKYISHAGYSNSSMIPNSVNGSNIDVRKDNKVINLTILPSNIKIVQPPMEEVIKFSNPTLESRIREIIKKPTGYILKSDVKDITYLGSPMIFDKGIEGIQYLTNLTKLELNSSQINDTNISVLKNLVNLKYLDLSNNEISDTSTLKALTNLTYLNLNGNKIRDIDPLKALSNLEELNLGANQISNIIALKDMTNLTVLWLPINQINDISALKDLKDLTYLNLNQNQISDISLLKDLSYLLNLELCANPKVSYVHIQSLQKELPKCTINYK